MVHTSFREGSENTPRALSSEGLVNSITPLVFLIPPPISSQLGRSRYRSAPHFSHTPLQPNLPLWPQNARFSKNSMARLQSWGFLRSKAPGSLVEFRPTHRSNAHQIGIASLTTLRSSSQKKLLRSSVSSFRPPHEYSTPILLCPDLVHMAYAIHELACSLLRAEIIFVFDLDLVGE